MPTDDAAKNNKRLKPVSETALPRFKNGIKPQFNRLTKKVRKGANKNKPLFAFAGSIISFPNSFKPSATGCNNP